MPIDFRKIIFLAFLIGCVGAIHAANSKELIHRNFWHPEYHGQRLNYCTIDNKQCGMAVATKYCQLMGYDKADQEIKDNNIGLTHFMDVKARCKGWQCNGFKTIRCVNHISHNPPKPYHYQLKQFVYPRFNHYRLDWCYDGQKGCGRKTAHSFCRRMGYLDVKNFEIQHQIAATQAIGNQKLCFGKHCNGFSKIDCYR